MEMGFHVAETAQSVTENMDHVPGMYVIWSSTWNKGDRPARAPTSASACVEINTAALVSVIKGQSRHGPSDYIRRDNWVLIHLFLFWTTCLQNRSMHSTELRHGQWGWVCRK